MESKKQVNPLICATFVGAALVLISPPSLLTRAPKVRELIGVMDDVGLPSQSPSPGRDLRDRSAHRIGTAATAAPIAHSYAGLPLLFEANRGQANSHVRFLSRGDRYTLFLTSEGMVLRLWSHSKTNDGEGVVRMEMLGANKRVVARGWNELPGKANYFIGRDPAKWHTNVPTYTGVKYKAIYPGVDLVYYGSQGQLEYDFIVSPQSDPRSIALTFEGARVEVDRSGDLVLHADGGDVRFKRPTAYQWLNDRKEEGKSFIDAHFVLRNNNEVGFGVAAYDRSRPLIIDPVLVYSTYLGGSFPDEPLAIKVDASGSAYVAGITCSADFPVTSGTFQTAHKGSGGSCPTSQNSFEDAFVTKFNAAGTGLVYSTYIGGSASDRAYDLALDSAGNVYLAGQTQSTDYPVTAGAMITTCPGGVGGCNTGVVTKLNLTGSALDYSTYLGGTGNMGCTGIAVNSTGEAYVTGATDQTFPTTATAFQTTNPRAGAGLAPVFAVLNATGTAAVYSTFLGGSKGSSFNPGSQAFGVAIDSQGHAYITGWTDSSDFPVTTGAFQTKCGTDGLCNGLWDAFVAKVDPTKSGAASLVYSTFLGGNGTDIGFGIAVDGSGNAYVTGTTGANVNSQFSGSALPSSDFPTTTGAFQTTCPGTCTKDSAWVTKLNASGTALDYSTYLGGSGNTGAGTFGSIALDSSLNAYVTGFTAAANFPTQNPTQATNGGGAFDAFVTELNASGSALVFSTFLGGNSSDGASSIALDRFANKYITGTTSSSNFPHTSGAFQTACPGSCTTYHGFVTKIGRLASSVSVTSSLNPSTFGQSVTFTATVSSASGSPTGSVTFKDGSSTLGTIALSSGVAKFTTTALSEGTHSITALYSGDTLFVPVTSTTLFQLVQVAGTPAVSFSPKSVSFSQQLVLSTSSAQPVTLNNTGTGSLTITNITAYGNFKVSGTTCPMSPSKLGAGTHCTISITFTPSQAGNVSGELTVIDNSPTAVQNVGLSGNGVTPLNTSPTGISFGTVTVGSTSAAKNVTLINNSTSSLSISFKASADYSAVGSGISPCGASLAGKTRCTISVKFSPKSNGSISGAVSISYSAASSPVEVALSGSGSGGSSSPLRFSPSSISFASQLVGTTSAAVSVTVTNTSAGSVTINSLNASGDFSAVASGATPCSASLVLASTKACTFSVTFKPTVNGSISGAVWVNDSSAVSPQVLSVSGKGAEAISLSPNSLNFGAIPVNTTSSPKTVTVTNNNQSSAVSLNPIVASGNFKISAKTCTSSLAAKSKCTFSVEFAPTAPVKVSGVASVSYGSLGSPQVVSLSGSAP